MYINFLTGGGFGVWGHDRLNTKIFSRSPNIESNTIGRFFSEIYLKTKLKIILLYTNTRINNME